MGNQIKRAIFIGGCERSGTTLLGAMLGAHSDCICTPESQFKINMVHAFGREEQNVRMSSVLNMIRDHWRFKVWKLDIDPTLLDCSVDSYSNLLYWLVTQYSENMSKPAARIWVDHTPHNIRYAITLGKMLPDLKLIHIVRDGRAVANSIIPLDWGPNTVIKAAPWWVEKVAYGLAVESMWTEDRIRRVRYEDLVQSTEMTLRKLCVFLGIDYQPEMIEATGFERPTYTQSQHSLIGKGLIVSRAQVWKKDLTSRQIELFENLTRDFLQYLGYSLEYKLGTKIPTRVERLSAEIWEFVRGKLINTWRHRVRRYSGTRQ